METMMLARNEILSLARTHERPCISLFAPVAREGYRTTKAELELKTLVERTEALLVADGLPAAEASRMLRPVAQVAEDGLRGIEGAKTGGMAFYIAPDVEQSFLSPFALPPQASVGSCFELRPLLAHLERDTGFAALTLSPNEVKLFRGSESALMPVDLPEGTPTSLTDYAGKISFEPKLAYHAVGPGAPGTVVGKWSGTSARDREVKLLDEYTLHLCKVVVTQLGSDAPPLVIVADERVEALARKHLEGSVRLTDSVPVSPDRLPEGELLQRCWKAVSDHHERERAAELERYRNALGTRYTASTVSDILATARAGEIEVLLTSPGRSIYGRYDDASGRVDVHPERQAGDSDLVAMAVDEALVHGTRVLLAPEETFARDCPMGAILRW
jgi:hypothetical protein